MVPARKKRQAGAGDHQQDGGDLQPKVNVLIAHAEQI